MERASVRRLAWGLMLAAAVVVATPSAASGSAAAPPPRSRILSEGWLFQPDPLRVGDARHWERPDLDRKGWRPVAVPMAWDEYDRVMNGYEGVGWYALALPADRIVAREWQRLRFGRANHRAIVWIDGERAGENLTGYLPFEVPLTPWLTPRRASEAPVWIVVRVENGTHYDWLPGMETVEWVQYGGLLEPVELLTTSPAYVRRVAIRGAPVSGVGRGGDVRAVVEIENTAPVGFAGRVLLEVEGRSAQAIARADPRATQTVSLALSLPEALPWSPDSPRLYGARVRLLDERGEVDAVAERFGVRSIEAAGREIRLNGRALRVRGVNRYDEFPDHGPVVNDAAIRADLLAVKATGANLIRTHYPQSPAHLQIADEIGLLYMEEVPLNWWRASFRPKVPPEFQNDRIVDLAEKALEEMVRRDGNHPSLVIWSMANECETADDLGVRAMERLLARAKALDPSRLATYVADHDFQKNRAFARADLVAANLYYGMWEGDVAEDLGQIDERVFAPTRAALQGLLRLFPDKPILVTEFGTIGVPGSGGDVRFSEDYQAAYVSAVWRAIESAPELAGGVVWSWADYRHRRGFTNDFPAEFGPFGLVTLDRRPKKAQAAMRELWTASSSDARARP
jgi:beta-glucuronidase